MYLKSKSSRNAAMTFRCQSDFEWLAKGKYLNSLKFDLMLRNLRGMLKLWKD